MNRDDKDPTLGRMTEVDWDDPDLQRLLESTETFRLDNRGTSPASVVHLRPGAAGQGADFRALLVGETGNRLRLLFDQALAPGSMIALHRAAGAAGGTWESCSVVDCRAGSRRDDQGRAIFVIELQAQRGHGPYTS